MILNIQRIVDKIKDHGKRAIVHVDLIAGLSSKAVFVDFIKENTRAEGIISTKPMLVRQATDIPLAAGGLLSDKKDIMIAFDAGVDAVFTMKEVLWYV